MSHYFNTSLLREVCFHCAGIWRQRRPPLAVKKSCFRHSEMSKADVRHDFSEAANHFIATSVQWKGRAGDVSRCLSALWIARSCGMSKGPFFTPGPRGRNTAAVQRREENRWCSRYLTCPVSPDPPRWLFMQIQDLGEAGEFITHRAWEPRFYEDYFFLPLIATEIRIDLLCFELCFGDVIAHRRDAKLLQSPLTFLCKMTELVRHFF